MNTIHLITCVIICLIVAIGCREHQRSNLATEAKNTPSESDTRGAYRVMSGDVGSTSIHDNVHAVCVGINAYRSPNISTLECAENDAKAVGKIFRDTYGYSTTLLLGEDAGRDQILETIQQYSSERYRNDSLIFYFAGHGQTVPLTSFGREGFLIPQDALVDLSDTRDVDIWHRHAIAVKDISDLLAKSPLRHVLVIADACYSGHFGWRGEQIDNRTDIHQLAVRPSRIAITAGTEGQSALEDSNKGHGIFTAAVLNALDTNRPLTTTELFVIVRMMVTKNSKNHMLPQLRPIVASNGEFIFIPQDIDTDRFDTALRNINKRILERVSKETSVADIFLAKESSPYMYSIDPQQHESTWQLRIQRFEENASMGDAMAMAALHYVSLRGLGVQKNPNKAIEWARMAYDSGAPAGKHVLANCYLSGLGVDRNEVAAWKLIEEAAALNFPVSMHSLALREVMERTSAESVNLSDNEIVDYFTAAGIAGSHHALYWLAALYLPANNELDMFGNLNNNRFFLSDQKDAHRAVGYLRQAAEIGSGDACHSLFNIYRTGYGDLQANNNEAIKWLTTGAELGHPLCQGTLGIGLVQSHDHWNQLFGGMFKKNIPEGMRWLELASKQNDHSSMMILVDIYSGDTPGSHRNIRRAREVLQELVDQGVPAAIFKQAIWYYDGMHYPKDEAKATQLLYQAAFQNSPDACRYLGLMLEYRMTYGNESHVEPEMLHWFITGAELGDSTCNNKISIHIEKYMNFVRNDQKLNGRSIQGNQYKYIMKVVSEKYPNTYEYLINIITKKYPEEYKYIRDNMK